MLSFIVDALIESRPMETFGERNDSRGGAAFTLSDVIIQASFGPSDGASVTSSTETL